MKHTKTFGLIAVLLLALLGSAAAQSEVKAYLTQTDPLLVQFQKNVSDFLPEIKGLREKRDLVGLKKAADSYIERWDSVIADIDKVTPPEEAKLYHTTFRRLCELQRESNVIMSETLGQRIQVVLAARKMKADGASQDEVEKYVKDNTPDRATLVAKTSAVKEETQTADATLKAERKRLVEMIKPKDEDKDKDKKE